MNYNNFQGQCTWVSAQPKYIPQVTFLVGFARSRGIHLIPENCSRTQPQIFFCKDTHWVAHVYNTSALHCRRANTEKQWRSIQRMSTARAQVHGEHFTSVRDTNELYITLNTHEDLNNGTINILTFFNQNKPHVPCGKHRENTTYSLKISIENTFISFQATIWLYL